MYTIGLFATGRGQGSRGLLEALHKSIQSGHLPVRIAFVFSNRDPGEFEATDQFFAQVRGYGYPLVTSSFRKLRATVGRNRDWRAAYDTEILRLLAPHRPDLCVLAGFLYVFGEEVCKTYSMVNLHPAAPGGPVGMWQEVIWKLIEQRARNSGNSMFAVTADLDRGPIVSYSTFQIAGETFDAAWKDVEGRRVEDIRSAEGESLPLFQKIRMAGMLRERPLVVATVRASAEGRANIRGGQVFNTGPMPTVPIDLTREIEGLVPRDS